MSRLRVLERAAAFLLRNDLLVADFIDSDAHLCGVGCLLIQEELWYQI